MKLEKDILKEADYLNLKGIEASIAEVQQLSKDLLKKCFWEIDRQYIAQKLSMNADDMSKALKKIDRRFEETHITDMEKSTLA